MELIEVKQIFLNYYERVDIYSLNKVSTGLINETFVVETNQGKYILQAINQYVFPDPNIGLSNIKLISEVLCEKNFKYNFPAPIQFKYVHDFNKIWRILPFIENTQSFDHIIDVKMVSEASWCMGEFYQLLDGFPTEKLCQTIPNFHNGEYYLNTLLISRDKATKQRKEAAEIVLNKVDEVSHMLIQFDQLVEESPTRVVHFDTKINNFLFDDKMKVKALIDLDTLMPGSVYSDIGDMIRTYANVHGEESTAFDQIQANEQIIAEIIQCFCQKISLSPQEKKNLRFAGKAITLMQCVRFLTDFLMGDIYYKTNSPLHNLDRAKNQLALFDSMKW